MPMSEFHVAFCGIATVAATLGYACARRAATSLASPSGSSKPDLEAAPLEERSLKRKLDDSDQLDVDTEQQSRPVKRNKTPPADLHQLDDGEWVLIVAPPPYEQAPASEESEQETPTLIKREPSPDREPSSPPPGPLSQPDEKGVEARRSPTPQVSPSPNEPETLPPFPVTPPKPATPKSKPTDAFSAFSGSSSPFASYSNKGRSPFALPDKALKTTPAWRRDTKNDADVFGQASSANALAPSPNNAGSSVMTPTPTASQSKAALEANDVKPPKASTYLTGEEDETVEAELKGVKLFTKRGRTEFTDGIYGHIKLLTQKPAPLSADPQGAEAEIKSRTRLLFRRDPLGQVSMNVGLHPTVRCHFDSAENILRVILVEPVSADSKEDVVIYALKPGRAAKADFQAFAKTLCDHDGLKSRLATSSAGAGEPVAS